MDGRFLQVLEGESSTVTALYASIIEDVRHKEVTQLAFEAIQKRTFSDWAMSLVNLSGRKLDQILALTDPLNESAPLRNLAEGRSKKLLMAFCEDRCKPIVSRAPRSLGR